VPQLSVVRGLDVKRRFTLDMPQSNRLVVPASTSCG
jgi:hypothetical protein